MYYDKNYFEWQKGIGKFGGIANKSKFEEHINKDAVVVDFGSGGGYLLKNIECKEKLGIEINEVARDWAKKIGVNSVGSIDEVQDDYADIIISNHALEHVDDPLGTLRQLHPKLKKNGLIVFVVPHEDSRQMFNAKDINNHLYNWTRQTLGNLFKEAGFKDIEVYNIRSKWPPRYIMIYNIFGIKIFNLACYLYALLKGNYQIKIITKK